MLGQWRSTPPARNEGVSVHDESQHPRGRGGKWVAKQGGEPDVDLGAVENPLAPEGVRAAMTTDDLSDEVVDYVLTHDQDGGPRDFELPETGHRLRSGDYAMLETFTTTSLAIDNWGTPVAGIGHIWDEDDIVGVDILANGTGPRTASLTTESIRWDDIVPDADATPRTVAREIARKMIVAVNRADVIATVAESRRNTERARLRNERQYSVGWSYNDARPFKDAMLPFPGEDSPYASTTGAWSWNDDEWAAIDAHATQAERAEGTIATDTARVAALDRLSQSGRSDAMRMAFPRVPDDVAASLLDGWSDADHATKMATVSLIAEIDAN